MARANHITIAEWVRRALAAARRREPASDMSKKLSAVRAAAQYGFPSGNVAEMLAEIERGYTGDGST